MFFALAALLLPLLSFILLSVSGKRLPGKGDWLATGLTGLSFVAALLVFMGVFQSDAPHTSLLFKLEWFRIGNTTIEAGITLDNLSVLMLGLVTFISLLVHIYSMAYMKGDPRYHRYWPYLSLFVFSMLGLVLSGNLLITYMCWELVGVASYLMIGFWFERPKAALASQKSFIINRLGDIGFLVALMSLFSLAGTFDIQALNQQIGDALRQAAAALPLSDTADAAGAISGTADVRIYIAAAGLTLAAFAKSAQFPLHTWLPDAMEGPTSVSSLIHAATMVAAGVFLLARMFPLFPGELLDVIAVAGTFTAFLAATVALVQFDIKKVLAYSTISQLGFMMLGIGTGHYEAAIFHLVTHAFFKCLLFLGAGAVIHHIHEVKHHHNLEIGEQDMRIMGGLRREMPLTFWVYTLAAAALAGLPFFSGFLSKEMILLGSFGWALEKGGFWLLIPLSAVATSLLTAWYIGRQWSLVFMGKSRTPALAHVKEGNLKMKIPMAVLGVFTLFIWFSLNPFSTSDIALAGAFSANNTAALLQGVPGIITWGLLLLALVGLPAVLYTAFRGFSMKAQFREKESGLENFLSRGWYLDPVYNAIFVRPVLWLGNSMQAIDKKLVDGFLHLLERLVRSLSKVAAWLDKVIVDGLVNAIGGRARSLGDFFRGFQTGRVQQYMALAVFGLMILYLIKIVLDK
ncbi:NADH-quinone oxidoreductase subunit L [Anseongella ginsenosidimutans]|uniref:NADH-quinone oxidoreductase subunit L n=1 Tax=Anseongella ginsenosidimutans TaxID=496056 RepID=UPI001CEF6345|nr:NADH-quinone oxidoreductase subunit L [Anseongella ginsenosidimutans]